MSLPSNLENLTSSHNLIAAKKARRREQIKEVLFDDAARREFLTGFHKRKLAKAEAARSKAKERQKQERLQARREQRQSLREQAQQNAAQVEKAYGAHIDEEDEDQDEEWSGISHHPDREHADEYEDEEQLATVTVVEDFDPDTLIHGPPKSVNPIPPSSSHSITPSSSSSRPTSATTNPPPKKSTSTKPKPKKIRYETKQARQRERTKQHARRAEKAELAGGKASRKNKSKRHNSKR